MTDLVSKADVEAVVKSLLPDFAGNEEAQASLYAAIEAIRALPPDDEVGRLREALEEGVAELEIMHGPHIVFDCHTHYETGEWMLGTEDNQFYEGGLPGWQEGDGIRETLLEYHKADLLSLLGDAGYGYGMGIIPVRIGKYPEEPPWEPDFARALMYRLEEGRHTPGIDAARAALHPTEEETDHDRL